MNNEERLMKRFNMKKNLLEICGTYFRNKRISEKKNKL